MKNILYNLCCLVLSVVLLTGCTSGPVKDYTETDCLPDIFPDYANVTIPPNIAPLNFNIKGEEYPCLVSIEHKNEIFYVEGENRISIPVAKWKKLLSASKGDSIKVTVFRKENDGWKRYRPFYWQVANQSIDSYLTYRLIEPTYANWNKMGIYQRNIETFEEKEIINNDLTGGNCMNCHSFCSNDGNRMVFHMRKNNGGTYLVNNGKVTKLNTKTKYTASFFVYPSWHPSGKMIAFTVNNTQQSFYMSDNKRSEVYDTASDIVVYDIEKNDLFTIPQLSSKENLEIFPNFAPDGKKLFFCSSKTVDKLPQNASQIVYSLCSIDFDPATQTFGTKVDTLISSASGKGVSFAHASPNGKFILCSMLNHGCFPSWSKESDLYLYNLKSGTLHCADNVNSDCSESYTSWSSNSNWFVFTSRRLDNGFNRPFIAYINEQGITSKPFLLPQKDPDVYIYSMKAYNIPQLTTNRVSVSAYEIQKCADNPVAIQVKVRGKKEAEPEYLDENGEYSGVN